MNIFFYFYSTGIYVTFWSVTLNSDRVKYVLQLREDGNYAFPSKIAIIISLILVIFYPLVLKLFLKSSRIHDRVMPVRLYTRMDLKMIMKKKAVHVVLKKIFNRILSRPMQHIKLFQNSGGGGGAGRIRVLLMQYSHDACTLHFKHLSRCFKFQISIIFRQAFESKWYYV